MDVFLVTLVIAAPLVVACVITTLLGRARRLLVIGASIVGLIPFVLAIWDPDGPCDDWCFFDLTPGDWFVIGVVVAVPLWLAWGCGVGAAALIRRLHGGR
jgi:hypothetical protein